MMKIKFTGPCVPTATLVANEFIDRYMPSANGEYVKVYLYLLRHAEEEITTAEIADALELTEGDVRRALTRWKKDGLLAAQGETAGEALSGGELPQEPVLKEAGTTEQPEDMVCAAKQESQEAVTGTASGAENALLNPLPEIPDKSGVNFAKLRKDQEFTELLYVIQRYLSKIFSQTDSETIAYLYDVLKLPSELLVYLAERCAQNRKTSLRYFESVALDWYRRGIRTAEQAQHSADSYSTEVYAVMKAFGLKRRDPGTEELRYIRKWFEDYGFAKELVLLACDRTLLRAHNPSFVYADRILTEWHSAGIHTVEEAKRLEEERAAKRGRKSGTGEMQKNPRGGGTRFSNFEQRDDDIDALALQMMKKQLEQA